MSNDEKDAFNLPAAAAALSALDRADLVNALKNKLQSLAGQHSNILDSLSPIVRKRVEFLIEIQSQHAELESKFKEERRALEAKYQKLYEPLYTKRYEIVNGIEDVEGVIDEVATNQEGDKATEEKGVPEFWLTAMETNDVVGEEITERDEGALKFLKDIKWHRIDNPEGFKLEFYFDSNPYFKNSVLTKTYHMIDDDDPILEKTIGTEIEWYPGKCLTKKVLKKKPRKGSNNVKPITKIANCASFFNFFNTPNKEDDDLDDDAVEDIRDRMEQDYNVGTTIRDKVIPHAVSWFTGEAVDDESNVDDDDDDDDDDDNGDDEEEDEDENDEDEEDEEVDEERKRGRKKKGAGVRTRVSQQSARAPECKQQ